MSYVDNSDNGTFSNDDQFDNGTFSNDDHFDNGTFNDDDSEANDNLTYVFDRWKIWDSPEAYAVPIVLGVIFVVGLLGNGTLVLSVLANKVMRTAPNVLIVSLAMGDFLLILIAVPMTSTIYTFQSWPYGEFACKTNEFLHTVSVGVSIFSLVALSYDRYDAIVNPMGKLTGRSTRTTVIYVAIIWLVSILLAIPSAVFSIQLIFRHSGQIYKICLHHPLDLFPLYPRIMTCAQFVIFFLLPMLAIAFFYIKMSLKLIQSSSGISSDCHRAGSAISTTGKHLAARKRTAYMVLSFVILFIICWLPRHVYLILWHFDHVEFTVQIHIFKIIGFCLKLLNSCINPIACYFMSGQYRKCFNRYLFCCCCVRPRDRKEDTSDVSGKSSSYRRKPRKTSRASRSTSHSAA